MEQIILFRQALEPAAHRYQMYANTGFTSFLAGKAELLRHEVR
jgi:hypothetical protein